MDIQINSAYQAGASASEHVRQGTSQALAPEQPAAAPVVARVQTVLPVNSAAMQEQVKNAVENMNRVVQNMPHGSNLEFVQDPDTKINVVKVVDKVTNDVIRQFPTEEMLSISKAIDKLQGLIIRQKA